MREPGSKEFRLWLGERGLCDRSAGDVCSRVKRLERLVDLTAAWTQDDLEVALIKASDFKTLSKFVQSQLRRAGKLRIQYLAECPQ